MLDFKLAVKFHPQKNQLNRLPIAGDALFISQLVRATKRPLLFITSDAYQLQRLESELSAFTTHLKILSFPDYEVLPYERQSPYVELIADRLRCLWQIQQQQVDVLLIQANSLVQRLVPAEYFNQRVLVVKIGDKINNDNLRKQLVNAGYQCVQHVYQAGEFAIRGSIIDLWIMGAKSGVRLDLFDDEIESIAYLDSKTQLSGVSLEQIEILPAREYPQDKEALKSLAARFVDYFGANNQLSADFGHNLLPAGIEFYLPLFFEQMATLFDYLNENWQIAYHADLFSQLNLNWQEINKRYEYYHYQYPCLKPIDLYLASDKILGQIKRFQSFEFAIGGEFYAGFDDLVDVSTDIKASNPFHKLINLAKTHKIILCVDGLGRLEILRHNLAKNQVYAMVIDNLSNLANLTANSNVFLLIADLTQGFSYNNYLFITERDLYPSTSLNKHYTLRERQISQKNDLILRDLAEINVGDYVVHINHGLGRYLDLSTQTIANVDYEMISVEYQNNSKLYIPVNNLHLISRYLHIEGSEVELTKLGSKQWDKIKTKTEQKVNDLAAELLDLYAKRELERGTRITVPNEYAEFVHSFGYEPTLDQQTSFDDIINDLASVKPMDRLLCGDVGFGKTEVAMRAAFITAMSGAQVAVLAPTTLLTEQLYQNFVERCAGFTLNIAEISRFRSRKEITQTVQLLSEGKIDIVIGTHRLIQDDIKFARLGLIIVDEEHRFGVKQKEKLKQLKTNVAVLTMTATPIPRTLSMALEGLRDFSIIATPPSRRLAVNTLQIMDDDAIIQEAIIREIRRGGQVFFLYNEVASIEKMYERLHKLLPELRIAIAHGQMPERALESTIRDFIQQRYNLLLCSTIIETGIDIPNANTILIYRADKFGLAQLHQLRGRVGRSYHQAYCYLIVPEKITNDAQKRLGAIVATSELGGGFNLAMHDLEIRGAGEILGNAQAGNIKEVGLSLYTEMLKKAIKKLKHGDDLAYNLSELHCEVNLNVSTILPADYCHNVNERLIYYKRLAKTENNSQLELIYQEIIDNYGLPPKALSALISMHQMRILASRLGVLKVDVNNASINLVFIAKPPIEPLHIVLLLQQLKTCRYDGQNKLIWQIKSESIEQKLENLQFILQALATPHTINAIN